MKIAAIPFTAVTVFAAVQASSVHLRVHAKAADDILAGPYEDCVTDTDCDDGLLCVTDEDMEVVKRKQAATTGVCVPIGSDSYSGSDDSADDLGDQEDDDSVTEKSNSTTTSKPTTANKKSHTLRSKMRVEIGDQCRGFDKESMSGWWWLCVDGAKCTSQLGGISICTADDGNGGVKKDHDKMQHHTKSNKKQLDVKEQCLGDGWTLVCDQGLTCVQKSDFYAECELIAD